MGLVFTMVTVFQPPGTLLYLQDLGQAAYALSSSVSPLKIPCSLGSLQEVDESFHLKRLAWYPVDARDRLSGRSTSYYPLPSLKSHFASLMSSFPSLSRIKDLCLFQKNYQPPVPKGKILAGWVP